MVRYPKDLTVTLEDFQSSGWETELQSVDKDGYFPIWSTFSDAAQKSIEAGETAKGKVLWLIADACSMMLTPEKLQEPYGPFMQMPDGRSAIPEDFSATDIVFFEEILDEIQNLWMKSRLADVIWLRREPRNVRFALIAIDAFRELGLDSESWIHNTREAWDRAFRLALMLGDGAGPRVSEMRSQVLSALLAVTHQDGFLGTGLADLLSEHRLQGDDAATVADHLVSLASAIRDIGDHHRYRAYCESAAAWYQKAADLTKQSEMLSASAESFEQEGNERMMGEKSNAFAGMACFENAIKTLRMIPRAERAALNVDERLETLRSHLTASGVHSIENMATVQSESIDISKLVEAAQTSVKGKDVLDALLALANLHNPNWETIKTSTRKAVEDNPLAAMFPMTVISQDGRAIAKEPGLAGANGEDDTGLWGQMMRQHGIMTSLIVQGSILPALEVLQQEHRIREADFLILCRQSPIVQPDRIHQWAKALCAGYNHDFLTSIHLLCPQIENFVRIQLKASGVTTTTLDQIGVEMEIGLSSLMDKKEASTILGENLASEIKAVFCDALGPNLRNEISHGLTSDQAAYSIHVIYAWWIGFRLVFNTSWNATQDADPEKEEQEES